MKGLIGNELFVRLMIANDLVIVQPMPSFTGSIQYYKFVAGSNKGGIKQGDEFNSPFALAPMSEERMNYTAQAVVDIITPDGEGKAFLAWTPLAEGFDPKLVGADSGASIEVLIEKLVKSKSQVPLVH